MTKNIFRKYRLEIVILLLVLVVVIFLVGNFGIQGIVTRILDGAIALLQYIYLSSISWLIAFSQDFSLMDSLGVVFIIGAGGFVFWRIRHHFQNDPEYEATACPRCGSSIKRVRRTAFDRLLGMTILPDSRRYCCTNRNCNWVSLRHRRPDAEPSLPDSEPSQSQ
jgi:hypothetical protein